MAIKVPAARLLQRARRLSTRFDDASAAAYARGERYARTYLERARALDRPSSANDLETYFDAHQEGPGIWKWRHYFSIYDRHLARFRNRDVDLIEIGIFSGGSLDMWHNYLGPGARVFGVDIEPACTVYETPNTRVFIGDQADSAFWADFVAEVPAFDIVIDDGGHEAHQQIATFEALLPHLRPEGVYICEDVHGPAHAFHAYVEGLARQLHTMGRPEPFRFASTVWQGAIDSIHIYPFVTVIEKRGRPLEILEAPKHGTHWQPFYNDPHPA